MTPRKVVRTVRARALLEGAGVRVSRSIALPDLDHLDPFLLLDEFGSDEPDEYIRGFPEHPHRGIETVTYMLEGRVRHGDSIGNSGVIGPGDAQWMTAGRGIVHSEMPEQDHGMLRGFQLWVNLPASEKMCAPRYQDVVAGSIPVVALPGGVRVRVVAGELGGRRGPVAGIVTDPLFLDVELPAGGGLELPLPVDHTAFAYVFEGRVELSGEGVEAGRLAVLGEGDAVEAAAPDAPGRFLLVAGRPLGEPVARWGPFVMNTSEEIEQAIEDYRSGVLARP